MKKLPYFPFYYLDWLSSSNVLMMTYEEKGLFIDMLCRCYNDDGLPDDNDKLQRLFRCDQKTLDTVKDMFFSVDGLLQNEKLEKIKKEQKVFIKSKSAAGKASAKARAAKKLQSATGVEQVLNSVETEAQRNSTNITLHNITEHNKTNNIKDINNPLPTSIDPNDIKPVPADKFHEYMDIYQTIKPYDITKVHTEARSLFREHSQNVDPQQIIVAAENYKHYISFKSVQPEMRKSVKSFISDRQYSVDWLVAASDKKGDMSEFAWAEYPKRDSKYPNFKWNA